MGRVQTVGVLYQHTSLVALSSMRGLGLLAGLQMLRASAIIARCGRSSLVSAPWLKENLGDPKLRVLDVTQVLDRSTNTVAPAVDTYMTSHVPSARFVDVAGRLSTPDPKLHNLGAFLRQTFDLSRRWRAGGNATDARGVSNKQLLKGGKKGITRRARQPAGTPRGGGSGT